MDGLVYGKMAVNGYTQMTVLFARNYDIRLICRNFTTKFGIGKLPFGHIMMS
jgi:hypothetical protein